MKPSYLGKGYGKGGYGEGYYGGTALPYYLSLITSQYQLSPKFLAWASAVLGILDDVLPVILNLDFYFDVENATGVQLDTLGQIVGVLRAVNFQPSNGVSPVLDDDTYRILLKATIAKNMWDGRINSLQPLWQQLFPGGTMIVQDNQNMSFTVILTGSFSSIIEDLISHDYIVPRPESVLSNIVIGTKPFLGFDRNDEYVAGCDVGHFV